jgi:hypothetical protein
MLPANLLNSLKALNLTDKPLITAAPDKNSASASSLFELGQKFQGTVQAQVAPNTFNVRVADQLLQMQLPAFIRSGDTITLQVTSLQPRLTFALSASSNPISTPDSLSAASRLLSSLSQQPLERSYVRPIQSSPLWAGEQTMPDTTQLASKLHDALSHSGLFYESHQAQWIAGTRPTTQLLLEPQNQLPATVATAPDSAQKNIGGADAQPSAVLTGSDARIPSLNNIPPHIQTLVQQQLNALETHQVLWQGQVWQGQEMRWEVREESPRRNAAGMDEGQWITQIDLDLPNLGGISARLSFNGNTLNLALDVSDPQTRDKLGSASSQLLAALAERGISVTHTQINQHEHTE